MITVVHMSITNLQRFVDCLMNKQLKESSNHQLMFIKVSEAFNVLGKVDNLSGVVVDSHSVGIIIGPKYT